MDENGLRLRLLVHLLVHEDGHATRTYEGSIVELATAGLLPVLEQAVIARETAFAGFDEFGDRYALRKISPGRWRLSRYVDTTDRLLRRELDLDAATAGKISRAVLACLTRISGTI